MFFHVENYGSSDARVDSRNLSCLSLKSRSARWLREAVLAQVVVALVVHASVVARSALEDVPAEVAAQGLLLDR